MGIVCITLRFTHVTVSFLFLSHSARARYHFAALLLPAFRPLSSRGTLEWKKRACDAAAFPPFFPENPTRANRAAGRQRIERRERRSPATECMRNEESKQCNKFRPHHEFSFEL